MGNKMTNCPWETIDEFQNPEEYEQFKLWIREQISTGNADEVVVEERYSGTMMREERWFKHRASNKIWRLVEPDPPFYGIFEPIPEHISKWKRIHGFKDRIEFEQFEWWIKQQIELGEAEEFSRKPSYDGDTSHEGRWFKHRVSGEIWRLQNPSPPFKGSFDLMNG